MRSRSDCGRERAFGHDEVYGIQHPLGCGNAFQVNVTAQDARVVEYSLTKGEPPPHA